MESNTHSINNRRSLLRMILTRRLEENENSLENSDNEDSSSNVETSKDK